MYKITSVKDITDSQWSEYFYMFQELNEKYYPYRYNRNNTPENFRVEINNSYNKITGYENYLIRYDDLPIGWFYLSTWGDVLYLGLYFNTEEISYSQVKTVLLFVYEIMKNKEYNELFTSSYRYANIEIFKKMNADLTEEHISSQIKRDEINISLLNSIVNKFYLNDFKSIYCSKISDKYADSYVECFNSAFSDLMNLNKVKLKYKPFTKDQLINDKTTVSEKHIVLLINKSDRVSGFSELYYDKVNKTYSCDSGFTAVLPEYRGKGIAKFLKAKLYLELVNKNNEFEYIKTNTLKNNIYINNINKELGFIEYRRGFSFRFSKEAIENIINTIE